MKRRLAASAVASALAIVSAGCTDDHGAGAAHDTTAPSPPSTTEGATESVYSLAATRRCLEQSGFLVGPVGVADPRLRALGDLAQQSSVAVRSGGEVVGLAVGDAQLLADLLAVPDDPYTIQTRGNAVLLYRPAAGRQAAAVRSCLRP